jgi:hypothetical protein
LIPIFLEVCKWANHGQKSQCILKKLKFQNDKNDIFISETNPGYLKQHDVFLIFSSGSLKQPYFGTFNKKL